MAKSAETKIQFLRRKALREKALRQGQDRPYFGFIKEYNPDTDTTLVDSHGGRRIIRNPQPHLGQSAWIRAAPDQGMGSLLITRSDAEEPEIMRWWHTDTQERLSTFRQNVEELLTGSGQLIDLEAFRPLQSGEIDLSSVGGAQLFLGRRPHLDMRAGIIKLTMDQDETEFASKSPIHVRRGYQHNSSEVGDEERFGVVKRPKDGSFVDSFYPDNLGRRGDKERRGFAKEYLMRLRNSQPSLPETLFDIRAGHVIDDEGQPFSLAETGLNLRSRAEYFTPTGTAILAQMDESTNWKIEHPDDAKFGGLYILPKGSLVSRIGVDFQRSIGRNEEVSIGVDRNVSVANNDAWAIGQDRVTLVGQNEQKVVGGNSDEVVVGNKTIKVNGTLVIQTGAGSSILGFTETTSAFETEVLSILAKQIIFEAPTITFNTPVANFTGLIRAEGGLHSNATIVSPNGARGRAGAIIAIPAIRTSEI